MTQWIHKWWQKDDLYTLSPCLTCLVFVLMITSHSTFDDITMTKQMWCAHVNSHIWLIRCCFYSGWYPWPVMKEWQTLICKQTNQLLDQSTSILLSIKEHTVTLNAKQTSSHNSLWCHNSEAESLSHKLPMSFIHNICSAIYIIICEKYSLSPLKLWGLALLSWHVHYNWGSGNSVHKSFTWFLSLNWCKSTFYRFRVPILFQN